MDSSSSDLDFTRVGVEAFEQCPADSIDYAVMEKTNDSIVIPMDAGWSDMGSWHSVWESGGKDDMENVLHGDILLKELSALW